MSRALRRVIAYDSARLNLGSSDVEDVLQDALLAIHLKRHTWDETRPIVPWLRAIAHYKVLDHARRSRRRVTVPVESVAEIIPAPQPEPDLPASTGRFLEMLPRRQREVLEALALTICAFRLSLAMQRPDAQIGFGTLAWPILLLLVGVGIELMLHPASTWTRRLIGEDPLGCFLLVSGLSLPILIAALGVLRQGAPAEPGLQGAMAGLLSAGVTSMLYVLHCPEPSLLYIAAWHVPAVLAVSFIGAKLGSRWLRW